MRCIKRVVEVVGSQAAVALALTVTQGTVSNWVLGRHPVDPNHYDKLCELSKGEFTPADFLQDELKRLKARAKPKSESGSAVGAN